MSGGIDKDGNTLKDAWLLNVNAATWKEVGWLQCMCKGLRHYLCEMQGTVTLVAYSPLSTGQIMVLEYTAGSRFCFALSFYIQQKMKII